MKCEFKKPPVIARAWFFAAVLLAAIAFQATPSRAGDITVNLTAVVQATQTLVTKGRSVAGSPFQVDHVSIINELYAIAEWSWGEGGGQVILINTGNAHQPSWKLVGGGGGRIDAAGLQKTYNIQPPYNVPLVANVLNCSGWNRQSIVTGMSSAGTACYQYIQPPTPAPTPTPPRSCSNNNECSGNLQCVNGKCQ